MLDLQGKVLISRNYRGDVKMSSAEKFAQNLALQEDNELKPIYTDEEDGTTYVCTKYNNLLLLSVTNKNSNAMMMTVFHSHFCAVLKSYFGELVSGVLLLNIYMWS